MEYDALESVFASTGSGRIHVLKNSPKAKSKSLVFLHGLGASTLSWKRLMPYIPDDFEVVLLDLLGHGISDAPHMDYTVELQASAVNETLLELGISDCVLVGNSYGGWVSAYGCAKGIFKNKLISGLVLEDSAGLKREFEDSLEHAGNYDAIARSIMKTALEMNNNKDYVIGSMLDPKNMKYLLTENDLEAIDAKCMVVWGSDDDMIDKKYSKVFSEHIKGSSLMIINGGGHVPHYNRPNDFAELIVGFCKR